MGIPAYERAIWVDGKVSNKGSLPLWSGKGEPPAIGSTVTAIGPSKPQCVITGYEVEDGWLMAVGYRLGDNMKGNLAGAEIVYNSDETGR